MCKGRDVVIRLASLVDWLPGLLSRICIGFIFIQSGWGKLHHLDKVIAFFTSLGIPAANLQAPFVASIELVGGSVVLIGLFTRVASIPLIGTMFVAILTAKRGDIHELGDLLFMPEFLFIVMLLWLMIKGAGALSVDHFLAAQCDNKGNGK
jgi:putative oxidoreductase